MRPMLALVLVSLLSSAVSQDTSTDSFNEKLNVIESKPSVRLDPYIRKALLKALTELEESDYFTTGSDGTNEPPTTGSELLRTSDDISIDSTPTINTNEEIRIHSFIVNGQAAFANNTSTTPMLIDNNISILSTTAGNVENQVTATLPTQSPFNEIFQTRESGINIQQVRSIASTSTSNVDSSIQSKPLPNLTKPTTSSTTTSTTTTTTTTTTPKPTHNNDGENIEDVDKRDVQVFQAPLVAAFTVHQDAQGQPKKVVSIFQQTNLQGGHAKLQPLAATTFPTGVLPPPVSQQLPIQNEPFSKLPQTDFINQQITLQQHLEEKQRILEEQLRLLQAQQRQQEELLRKQQFLFQQKEVQRQQQILLDQQRLLGNQANNFAFQGVQKSVQQNPFVNQNIIPQNSQVTIHPSVSIDQNSVLTNQQQLPNREAVDFLIHLRSQQQEQFPLQENHLPQGISNFLQPSPIQSFHQGIKPNNDPFRQKQGNRVFRQETGVGNFGFNNQNNQNFQNRFNTFNPVSQNRFFFNRPNQYSTDVELKQLLAQNGLSGRSHEDLNIVSKVLSLNHGIPINHVSNRLPFDSRTQIRQF